MGGRGRRPKDHSAVVPAAPHCLFSLPRAGLLAFHMFAWSEWPGSYEGWVLGVTSPAQADTRPVGARAKTASQEPE